MKDWFNKGQIFKYNKTFDIFYYDTGINTEDKDGPVLLVIHGFPANSFIWRDLVPEFKTKFSRIIIPDLMGLGFSDKPIGYRYTMMEQSRMLVQLLTKLKLTNIHVVAHDYGVSIGQELVHQVNQGSPEVNVKSVCFLNGGLVPSRHSILFIQKLFSSPTFKKIMPYLLTYPIYKNRLSSIFGPHTRPTDTQLQDIWAIMLHKNGHIAIPDIFTYLFERKANEMRWLTALQETKVPLHLVYGPEDPVNTPDGFLKTYKELVPNSSITVLDNVGHYPQVEDPEGFIASYMRFLEKVKM